MNAHGSPHPQGGDGAHQEAQELLPWLANGRLAGPELERVQRHLRECAGCRAELAALHTLRAAGQEESPAIDAERALARLLPRLDAPVDAPPAPAAPAAGTASLRPVRDWRARLAANDARWLRVAAGLQCCVIAVLAALLLAPSSGADPRADPGAGDYRVLGAEPAQEGQLIVTFRPDTPEHELRRIVGASGAHLAGGPTATGAWLLAGDAPMEVARRLRAEPAVTLAEPLLAPPAPGRP